MPIQLAPLNLKSKLELKGFIKLNKEIFGADAGDTTDYWRESIPFWIMADDVPVGTTAAWSKVRYTDGEDFEPEHDGWLYIGDLGVKKQFAGKEIERFVVDSWVSYAKKHGYKAISTNEVKSNILFGLYKAVGFKEVGHDEYFGDDEPNIILELILAKR